MSIPSDYTAPPEHTVLPDQTVSPEHAASPSSHSASNHDATAVETSTVVEPSVVSEQVTMFSPSSTVAAGVFGVLSRSPLPALEDAEAVAEALVLLVHRGVNWDVWGSRAIRYWDAFTERVRASTYAGPSLSQWWQSIASELDSQPRNAQDRADLAGLLACPNQGLVLDAFRRHAPVLVLRIRVLVEHLRTMPTTELSDEMGQSEASGSSRKSRNARNRDRDTIPQANQARQTGADGGDIVDTSADASSSGHVAVVERPRSEESVPDVSVPDVFVSEGGLW